MKLLIIFALLGLIIIGAWILIIQISKVGSKIERAIEDIDERTY